MGKPWGRAPTPLGRFTLKPAGTPARSTRPERTVVKLAPSDCYRPEAVISHRLGKSRAAQVESEKWEKSTLKSTGQAHRGKGRYCLRERAARAVNGGIADHQLMVLAH